MRALAIVLLASFTATAADENLIALAARARADFEAAERAPSPALPQLLACIQSQAMVLPVTRTPEQSAVYYRKGYCELLAATVTQKASDYHQAGHDLLKAIEVWPQPAKHNLTPVPVSSGLRVLAAAAHLIPDGDSDPRVNQDLEAAVAQPECGASDMPASKCEDLVRIGRWWLGWIAAREGRLADAARWFEGSTDLGWSDWVAGRQAMGERRFPAAVKAFSDAARKFAHPAPPAWLGPRTDLADAEFRLGMAHDEVKDYRAAIRSFDEAIKLRPTNARAIFLRGQAREMLGESGLADYDLASRTAFANVDAPGAGGQAHLYRGVALYRRKDYPRAEQEFSSALNFDSGAVQRDAAAWRHMAAVASGACGPSVTFLEKSLDTVSDFFPRNEAQALIRNCPPSISEVVKPAPR